MPSLRHHLDLGCLLLQKGQHPERARRDAELLLLHVLREDRAWLLTHADEELDSAQAGRYSVLLDRRRQGEPIQYITGETEFYGLTFHVAPGVLIPRPETEHLVEKVLELAAQVRDTGAKAQDDFSAFTASFDYAQGRLLKSCPDTEPRLSSVFTAPRIVDVGTGSGAIAVALARNLPHASITAIDISARALAIARDNAEHNGVAPRFLRGDLLAPVSGERFDFVVSNPPYVPSADRATLSVEVREYEPALALIAGEDGLEVYRRLIPAAFNALIPGGFLVLEIGYGQSSAISELLTHSCFEQIEFVPDLQGIPRVACARRR